MTALNEQLLEAWLTLSTTVINDKVVSEMSYNESVICNLLYRARLQNPDRKLTATDLCRETRMLKSQMNRTLNAMEEKGIISRERSTQDKRQIFITFHEENSPAYLKQHEKIIALMDAVIARLGTQRVHEAIALFQNISDIAGELLYPQNQTERKNNI